MREIKFRAWDRKEKRMWEVLRYTFEGHPTITVQFNPTIKKWHEEFEIMQFTGLLDKNGKKIYEGDIIACNLKAQDGGRVRGVVSWRYNEWTTSNFFESLNDISFEKTEVIGNIYENSDLLK